MILSYLDRSFEFRLASWSFVDLVGFPASAILGRTPRDVLGHAAGDALTKALAEAAAGQTVTTVLADPEWAPAVTWHSVDVTPEVDDDGEVDGFWVCYRVEQRPRVPLDSTSDEYHRGLFESAPDGIIVFNGGIAVRANPLAERILGYPPGGLVGRTPKCLSSAVPDGDDDAELIERSLRELPAGRVLRREWRALKADGSRVDIEVSMSSTNVGGVREVLCHLRDNTPQVNADARAARSRAQVRAIVEGALDGIVLVDSSGSVLSFNRAALEMFGYEPEQVQGAPFQGLFVPPDAPERDDERLEPRDLLALTGRREELALRADGTTFPTELSVVRLETSGAPFFAGFLRDLTETKRLEEQYRRAQKMEAVARLTAGVAHDFNNLLTPILGYADLTIADSQEEVTRESARQIRGAAGRGARLVERLLSFARPSTEGFRTVDLASVVGGLELLVKRLIGDQVALVVDVEVEALLHGDQGQLEQVIMNLATNASDAMPQGGTLMLRVVVEHTEEPRIKLVVSDSGTGIEPDRLERIFDPFFTTKATGKGTGLGLATVFGIVESHGGVIEVRSVVGQGTTFEMSFKNVAGRVGESVAGEPPMFAAAPDSVALLVDDDPVVRAVTRKLLSEAGYTVTEASDAIEALELMEDMSRLDLAVTDFSMPGVNGAVLATEIRRVRPEALVVIMSGHTAAWDADRPEGVVFLPKPFGRSRLMVALHEASTRHAHRGSGDSVA